MVRTACRMLSITVAALLAAGSVAAAATATPSSQSSEQLLLLERRAVAHATPSAAAPVVAQLSASTPLTGAQTVLPVLRSARGEDGKTWLKVRLPARPNGATGWVTTRAGTLGATTWRIVVHRDERRAIVLDDGKPRATFTIIVGKPSTPTPLGTFFVVEKLHIGAGKPEGPWALATSAYSNILQEYDGGPGQVALHGTTGLTGTLGTFASHGCIRFAPAAITWIADHVDAGTTIVVTR